MRKASDVSERTQQSMCSEQVVLLRRMEKMKRLTCEMCGSTDLIKQNGVFVCQSCGCKYSVEEARKLMIEGKVDVSGSTVKIDKTNEIENLLIVARRARDEGNYERAASNYDDVLKISPNNWEANFYRSYCMALEGRIIDIPNNLRLATSSASSTIKMLQSHEQIEDAACIEIISRISAMVSVFINSYYNMYSNNPEWLEIQRDKYGFESDSYVHNKGNYMRMQQNIDGVLTTAGAFYGEIGGLKKTSSAICEALIIALEKEKQELGSLPKNPFANAGLKYRQFFNLLANQNNALISKVTETKNVMEQICKVHRDLEEKQKEIEEEKRKKEQQRKNQAYWTAHKEEKNQLESKKRELILKVKELLASMLPIEEKINSLSLEKNADVPSQKEWNALQAELDHLVEEKDKLGFFKRKEKQSLQEKIEALTPQMEQVKTKIEKEKDDLFETIDREIAPLQKKLAPLSREKEKLLKQIKSIETELTKDRDWDISTETVSVNDTNETDYTACELCGELFPELILANMEVDTDQGKVSIAVNVCEKCFQNNNCTHADDNSLLSEPDELHADETPLSNGEEVEHNGPWRIDFLSALSADEKSLIQRLKVQRGKKQLQEDMFLEDMERERNLKQLIKLWDTYEFDDKYPSIGTALRTTREKEKATITIGGMPDEAFSQVKKDLSSLFKDISTELTSSQAISMSEIKVQSPSNEMYCEKCRTINDGTRCRKCGNKKLRRPAATDICFLTEKGQIDSNILSDELKNEGIAFTSQARQGAGLTMTLGSSALETYRFYVPYKNLRKALDIVQSLE